MRKLLVLMTLMLMAFSTQPHAQTTDTTAQSIVSTQESSGSNNSSQYEVDVSKFVEPSYPNLAKLYWNLGILDINSDEMIDNFLAITDCEMVMNYQNNDLEWREIRNVARESIRRNYKSWPTSFKITVPLYLRAYNAEQEYFEVDMKKSGLNASRKIGTAYNNKPITCRRSGEINGYPRNLTLFLNRPFSLPELPVDKELARLFIDEVNSKKKKITNANKSIREEEGERMAYLEIMFKVHSFKEVTKTLLGLQAVVFTQIDHFRVFADFDKEKLLYEQSMFETGKRKRRKNDNGPITGEDLNLPEGPLFGTPSKKKQ